jgi:hypothetical protein
MSWKANMMLFLLKYIDIVNPIPLYLLQPFFKNTNEIDIQGLKKCMEMINHDFHSNDKTLFPTKEIILFMQKNNLIPLYVNTDQMVLIYETLRSNFYASIQYELKLFPGKTLLFEANDISPNGNGLAHAPGVEIIKLPAGHFNILRDARSLDLLQKRLSNESK